jgi:hypothetical protein
MLELAGLIASVEQLREPGLVSYGYFPQGPLRKATFSLDIAVRTQVCAKELLCELHLYAADGSSIETKSLSWPTSSKLMVPYQYLPDITERALVKLRSFESETPFAAAVLQLRPWKREFAPGDLSVMRCFAAERISLAGKPYFSYQALKPLGSQA